MNSKPPGAGKSSLDLVDRDTAFDHLDIRRNSTFLDLACGAGHYSLALSEIIGEQGMIYAVDLWEDGIALLNDQVEAQRINNIRTFIADISETIPLGDSSIDVCLLATALHDLPGKARQTTLQEIFRVLKPESALNIIEFKKIEEGPGPPVEIRLDEMEVVDLVSPQGFIKVSTGDVGAYHYLVKFRKSP